MELALTLASLFVAVGLGLLCGWRGALPFDPVRGPRLVPWRLLMVTAAVVALLLLTHVATLLGLKSPR